MAQWTRMLIVTVPAGVAFGFWQENYAAGLWMFWAALMVVGGLSDLGRSIRWAAVELSGREGSEP